MNMLENDVKELNKYNTYVDREELTGYLGEGFKTTIREIFDRYDGLTFADAELSEFLHPPFKSYLMTRLNTLVPCDMDSVMTDSGETAKEFFRMTKVTPEEWLELIGIQYSKPTKNYETDKINIEDIHYICEYDYIDCQKPVLTVREALFSEGGKKNNWITIIGEGEDGSVCQQKVCLSITGLKELSSDLMKLALQLEKEGD